MTHKLINIYVYQIMEYQDVDNDFNPNSLLI